LLASGCADHIIRFWNPYNGDLLSEIDGLSGNIWSISFSPDGQFLASCCGKNFVIWDIENNEKVGEIAGHENNIPTI